MGIAHNGYYGRALIVDATEQTARALPLPEQVLRDHLGGVGLGAWLLRALAPPGLDPLAPESPLAFCFSPLVGTPLTTSAKFAVVAKSPLTRRLNDALASSHFAISGKLSGHDAIVIQGRSETQSVVVVDGPSVHFEDASELLGLSAGATEERLRERLGAAFRVAAIGPAGERGVRYATISHDGRHAGRGGLGAVLGSKNIKALAVRGKGKVSLHDPDRVMALSRDLRERSFGRATEKYRSLGTLANLLAMNAVNALPTRNFQSSTFAGAGRLAVEELQGLREIARRSCASCTIGCEHIYATPDGKGTRVEYENVFALGPMCGVSDPDAVLEAARRCDEHGIDTISAGGTIAWAMECVERGLLDAPWLRFGDSEALLRAVDEIGRREGLGELLAEGSRLAALAVGEETLAFAPQVKGLELPGYDPRTLHTMALGLAVNARGADHNRTGAYEADLSGSLDRFHGGPDHVAAAIETEDRAALQDSMILCKFLRGVFDDPLPAWAELLSPVTGWELTPEELRATAERIVLTRRLFNLEEGWTRAEDWLPERLLADPVQLGAEREARLTPERLEGMVDTYFELRGLDETGAPDPAMLEARRIPARFEKSGARRIAVARSR